MIYLDYAADTPVNDEVLNTFVRASRTYFANPNGNHDLGKAAKAYVEEATKEMANMLHVKPEEIIYTSGATESNNLAIKGIAEQYGRKGKHMITTYLEHSSVTGPISYLQEKGFEIDFVDLLPDGQIDLDHLKELLRSDTILVSIAYVDSELGILQNIEGISKLLVEYPNCFFHVDATQALGKVPVTFKEVDLITFTAHKLYGLHGIGALIKKEHIFLSPVIHGGLSTTPFRSGTPTVALIASMQKALKLALLGQEEAYHHVASLNQRLKEALKVYPKVLINSTEKAVPYILNISLKGIKAADFHAKLEANEIYISMKSACTTPNTPSRPVMALTKDRKRALSTLRISLSHLTTLEEVENFIQVFDQCYQEFKIGRAHV